MTIKVGYKLWFEVDKKPIMGPGRASLLKYINEYGSLSAAARHLNISYRHAYMLIKDLNRRCGEPIIETTIGGKDGGGMKLTSFGKKLLLKFGQVEERIRSESDKINI